MRLCTFILDADVPTSFERLLGSSWFAVVHKVITYLKEQIPIAAFTIGQIFPRPFLGSAANEGISLFFTLWCSHVNRQLLLYRLPNI